MERHLKKVYDCLNIGCNKKAVQEVDRLPKIVSKLAVFKALKALALIRMQKRRQAFSILDEINPEDDLDEVTLQTMTSCFKESFEVSRIVDLYEAALKRKPSDQDILVQLFMAYVRIFNFKRQKEIAMVMYKNFPKKSRLYTFWAIISLVKQAQETSSPDSADFTVCLKLAEKMCERMIDDKATNEEIELYLTILRKQKKYEEEYKFLTGPICLRVSDHLSWFNRRRAFLCLDLRMYYRAFKHYFPTLIQDYPEQIEYYQGLFKSAFLLDIESQQSAAMDTQQSSGTSSQSAGTPVKSTSALAECIDIVERQCSMSADSGEVNVKEQLKPKNANKSSQKPSTNTSSRRRLLRGPYMARIELYYMVLSQEEKIPKNIFNTCKSQFGTRFPSFESILLDYFQNFSKKIICYQDMIYLINEFKSQIDKESLLKAIEAWIQEMRLEPSDSSALNSFYIDLNYLMLRHSVHQYKVTDRRDDRIRIAKECLDFYNKNRHLGKDLSKAEFQPVDSLSLIAINSIMTNSMNRNLETTQTFLDDQLILNLIVIAEDAIANSPANHQLKLTLLKLYSIIGASKQCSEVLVSLDIKHFQIDTLGHLLNPVLYNTGNYMLTGSSLDTCLEFYAHGIRECFEGLTQSYKDGRFNKVAEIGNILKRLNNSLNFSQCTLLKAIVSLVSAANGDELNQACNYLDPLRGLQRIFLDSSSEDELDIRDNRDFKVLKSLHSETDNLIQQRQRENLEDEKLWMRLRYYMLYCIYVQVEYMNGDQSKSVTLAEICTKIELIQAKLARAIPNDQEEAYSYLEPESSPVRWRHIDIQLLTNLVIPLLSVTKPSMLTGKLAEDYGSTLELIVDNVEKQASSVSTFVQMKQALLTLTISIEFISFAISSLYLICHLKVNQNQTAGSQGRSPPSQHQAPPAKLKSVSNQMIGKTEALMTRLANVVKSIEPKSLFESVISVEPGLEAEDTVAGVDGDSQRESALNRLMDKTVSKR